MDTSVTLYQQNRRMNLSDEMVLADRDTAPEFDFSEGNPYSRALSDIRDTIANEYATLLRRKNEERDRFLRLLHDLLDAQHLTDQERRKAFEQLSTEFFGFGKLDALMQDKNITEIIVDGPHHVDIERSGRLERLDTIQWDDDEQLQEYIKGLLRDTGRSLDTSNPIVHAEVAGARVNATMPPVTEFHTLNIRKSTQQTRQYSPQEYLTTGACTPEAMRLLRLLARGGRSILIGGPTSSGKTTLARILIESGVRPETRWIMLEDVRETQAHVDRWVSMQTVERKENPIDISTLFNTTKRKRPDRIAVGELLTGAHALAYIRTTMAGHEGTISTIHALNEFEAIFSFIFFLKEAGLTMEVDFLERMLHRQIHFIVIINRFPNGRRRVTRIVEVLPIENGGSGFQTIMQWNAKTDALEWVHDLSEDTVQALEINQVVIPHMDEHPIDFDRLDAPAAIPPTSKTPETPPPGPSAPPQNAHLSRRKHRARGRSSHHRRSSARGA